MVDTICKKLNFTSLRYHRLDDMVESVREHGVLVPAIVRTVPGGYEMLAGHNRLNAARLAGL